MKSGFRDAMKCGFRDAPKCGLLEVCAEFIGWLLEIDPLAS
jgi:hypothetical protein